MKFAILGLGRHAQEVVIPAFADCPSAKLHFLATSSASKQKELKKKFPEQEVKLGYNEVLTSRDVQAVYISLPNSLHYEWTKKSLEAGKHVLCEKPLCTNYKQARELNQIAVQANRNLHVGFMYRFHPQHQIIKSLLKERTVGQIKEFHAHFSYDLKDYDNIRLKAELGGGALLDVGCYTIDVVNFLFEEKILKVSSKIELDERSEVDSLCEIQMELSNQIRAKLTSGCKSPRNNYYSIIGTKGKIHLESAFRIPRNKKVKITVELDNAEKKQVHAPTCNQAAMQIELFSRLCEGETVDLSLFSDGLQSMKIIDQIREDNKIGSDFKIL